MKRNKYIKYIISSLLISILSLAWIIAIYHSNKIDIESKLEPSLRVAIDRDLNTRFVKSGMPYYTPNSSTKINKKLITKDGKSEKMYLYRKTDIPRYTNFMDELIKQSCLNDFLPIDPDTLNNYFNNELQLKNIHLTTAIKITNLTQKHTKTTQDTIIHHCVDYKYSYLLGNEDELRLDAYIHYVFITILFYKGVIWLPLFISICTLIICFLFSIKYYQFMKENKIAQLDDQTYRLGENIFNIKEGILYKNGKPCKIRKQKFKLLFAFLQAPNNFLSMNDINNIVWEDSKNNLIPSRIHTLVSDLRKDIAPDLDITKETNKGYRLCSHVN